jgi:quinol-cytochrome oxidoreductase complex cytochrome b subunit
MADQDSIDHEDGVPFFPGHFLKEVAVIFVILALLMVLVALFPATLGPKADPLNTPEHIKPEWYFLSVYQLLKLVPRALGIVGQIAALMLVLAWPFLDRGPVRDPARRPIFLLLSLILVLAMIILGVWGHLS